MSLAFFDIVSAARALIRDRSCWTTKVYARSPAGIACLPIAPDATCWCAVGAIQKAAAERFGANDVAWAAADATVAAIAAHAPGDPTAGPATDETDLASFNDRHGHAAVIDLFDAAIERARKFGGDHVL